MEELAGVQSADSSAQQDLTDRKGEGGAGPRVKLTSRGGVDAGDALHLGLRRSQGDARRPGRRDCVCRDRRRKRSQLHLPSIERPRARAGSVRGPRDARRHHGTRHAPPGRSPGLCRSFRSSLRSARRQDRLVAFSRQSLRLAAIVSVSLTVVLLLAAPIILSALSIDSPTAVVLTALITIPAFLITVLLGLAQGLQRFPLVSIGVSVAPVARIVLVVGLLVAGYSVAGAMGHIGVRDACRRPDRRRPLATPDRTERQ